TPKDAIARSSCSPRTAVTSRSGSRCSSGTSRATSSFCVTSRRIGRFAAVLMRRAVDVGVLRGSVVKEFASYHLPERSFLYLLHALRERKQSPRKVIDAREWRMFLMRTSD